MSNGTIIFRGVDIVAPGIVYEVFDQLLLPFNYLQIIVVVLLGTGLVISVLQLQRVDKLLRLLARSKAETTTEPRKEPQPERQSEPKRNNQAHS